MKGRTGKREKRKGKQPKPYWRWNERDRRWYHPAVWASLVGRGLLMGGGVSLGHWLAGMWLPAIFDPATFAGSVVSSVKSFMSEIADIFD